MDNLELFYLIFNQSHRSPILDNLMIFITHYLISITILIMFILVFKGKSPERKAILLAILTLPIALLLIQFIHLLIYEPRPFVTYNFSPLVKPIGNASFPSIHASLISALAFSYVYFKSKWAYLFVIFMILVGLSRIYVGVHYPLDVLGGFVTGSVAVVLAIFSVNLFKAKI